MGRKCHNKNSGFQYVWLRAENPACECRRDWEDGRRCERVQHGATVIVDNNSEQRCGDVQDSAGMSVSDSMGFWSDCAYGTRLGGYPGISVSPLPVGSI